MGGVKIKIKLMLVMGYLGAVIGAGFASGQEIVQFFVIYGEAGFKGALLATILFGISGAILMQQAHKLNVSRYQVILTHILGNKTGQWVDLVLALFLFLGISTMLSASGAVFNEHLYLHKNIGILTAYAVVVAFLFWGKRGMMLSFNLLVPCKILLLIGISAWAAFGVEQGGEVAASAFSGPPGDFWALSSFLYVAYNFSLAMVVLTEYQSISSRKEAIQGAGWGGLLLGIMVMITYTALYRYMPVVLHYEVPMLYVAGKVSLPAKFLYTGVLWIGILTTAIANAFGFAQRFSSFTGIGYSISLILCMTLALPLSLQSFSQLVGKVYPLFGVLGIIIVGALWVRSGKDTGKDIYYNIVKSIAGQRR